MVLIPREFHGAVAQKYFLDPLLAYLMRKGSYYDKGKKPQTVQKSTGACSKP